MLIIFIENRIEQVTGVVMRILAPLLLCFLLIGCTTGSDPGAPAASDVPDEEPDLFIQIAEFVDSEARPQERIAVYPFSDSEDVHPLSDFLVEGITAELSNRSRLEIINRSSIETVLEELQLQLTGLIDEKSSVRVGQFLGASLIVGGFIEQREMVVQLIDVETSENLAGRRFTIPEPYFDALSEKRVVRQEYRIREEGVFAVSVLEDFSDSRVFSSFTARTFGWGNRFVDSYAALQPIDGEMRFNMYAAEESAEPEGDVSFELQIPLEDFPEDSRGFYIALESSDDLILVLNLGERFVPHFIPAGRPQELLIPWALFGKETGESLKLIVNVDDNLQLLREGEFQAAVDIGEFGVYISKNEGVDVTSSFEDEELTMAYRATLYGLDGYMDYSEIDEGIWKADAGVEGFSYSAIGTTEGAVGKAMQFDFRLTGLNDGVEEFFSDWGDFTIYLNLLVPAPADSREIRFWLQSDVLRRGSLDIYHEGSMEEYAAYADISITPFWADQRVPLEQVPGDGVYSMILSLEIPRRAVRQAIGQNGGELTLTLGLDEIIGLP